MRPGQTVVQKAHATYAVVAACAATCASAGACTNATGGAVDLNWRLKPAAGFAELGMVDNFIDCGGSGALTVSDSGGRSVAIAGVPIAGAGGTMPTMPRIPNIRLYWQTSDVLTPPEVVRSKDFKCSTENGVTNFEVPPGDALLYVAPICEDEAGQFEAGACTYTAPAPVVRTMVAGQTVELGALEIILNVGTGTAPYNSCSGNLNATPPIPPKQTTCICSRTACP
jgi:hypothetical protein